MKQKIFELKGKVVNNKEEILDGLFVTIVDKDFLFDDILGAGFTDKEGNFRISFVQSEFNQDFFEKEDIPDIEIFFSVMDEGELRPVCKKEFKDLKFEKYYEDLGIIKIESWNYSPVFLENLEPFPKTKRRVKRLDIDENLIKDIIEEVSEIVEKATGWKNLTNGIEIKIDDNLSEYIDSYSKIMNIPDGQELVLYRFVLKIMFKKVYAVFNPYDSTIYLNKEKVEYFNLDALKVILGHELVHVGQFKEHPEFKELNLKYIKEIIDFSKGVNDFDEFKDFFQRHPINDFMNKIEGYAYYIQVNYLQEHYNLATFFNNYSFFEIILKFFLGKVFPELDQIEEIKKKQYLDKSEDYEGIKTSEPIKFEDF